MYRLGNDLCLGNCRWIERRPAPCHVERQTGKVDNAPVAAVAAQVVRRAHENTIDRTRFDTQSAKHAFAVVDGVAGDLESFAPLDALFPNVDTVDGTSLGTLVTGDTSRQVKPMKPTIPRGNRHRKFGVLEVFGKRLTVGVVRLEPGS